MSRRAMAHGFRSRDVLFVDSVTSRGWPQKSQEPQTCLRRRRPLSMSFAFRQIDTSVVFHETRVPCSRELWWPVSNVTIETCSRSP